MASPDATFSALAHPVRRQMLDKLLGGPTTVSELGADHGVTPGAISQHLRVLEQADMIRRRLNGRQHYIELDERGFQPVLTWAQKYGAFWGANLESLGEFLMREKTDER
ncbi:metalloregulator ArsR/SmtB family transcription factor [uncultured Tateyamaria sp.]|uniref:ArsR/SmtB family transcription factor n=1 Tax=uncultured Tateyamaria sp. TaxID=455651 RepID=UPI002605A8EC|nr:metalloregulator ArsR/SmtB family transcription factor [uncultured Tateyamaria sp.]